VNIHSHSALWYSLRRRSVKGAISAPQQETGSVVALDCQATERPSAPRRTKQVLDAAETCFRDHGFHATSMAQIAAAAKMSVGHIYRYFSGKEDIIGAIVSRDVQAAMADFDAVEGDQEGVFPAIYRYWRHKFEWMADRSRSCLWLEILAESARNPEAAQVVRQARARVADRMRRLIAKGAPGRWSDEEIRQKVELLMMMMDAAAFRTISDPEYEPARAAEHFLGFARCIFDQD
jgi:TetR/AcrR family transcriptional regulator, repressor for uid operon